MNFPNSYVDYTTSEPMNPNSPTFFHQLKIPVESIIIPPSPSNNLTLSINLPITSIVPLLSHYSSAFSLPNTHSMITMSKASISKPKIFSFKMHMSYQNQGVIKRHLKFQNGTLL